MPATQANPTGHWENVRISQANENILDQLGGSWFDPPPATTQFLARGWATPVLRVEVECVIEQAASRPVAIKDPRIGAMIPLWRPILENQFHPVLAVRHPVEIALSLFRRDGIPLTLTLTSWELHMSALLDYLDGQVVTVAPYACLIEDRQLGTQIVEQAAAHIAPTCATYVKPAEAPGAIECGFRHNHADASAGKKYLTRSQVELWRLLVSLRPGSQSLDFGCRSPQRP